MSSGQLPPLIHQSCAHLWDAWYRRSHGTRMVYRTERASRVALWIPLGQLSWGSAFEASLTACSEFSPEASLLMHYEAKRMAW